MGAFLATGRSDIHCSVDGKQLMLFESENAGPKCQNDLAPNIGSGSIQVNK